MEDNTQNTTATATAATGDEYVTEEELNRRGYLRTSDIDVIIEAKGYMSRENLDKLITERLAEYKDGNTEAF